MAIINASDLTSANKNASSLDRIITSSKVISNKIDGFILESKSMLVGGGFDAVRIRLSLYSDALKKLSIICTNLKGNMLSANNTMINYMEGFSYLDDSYKDDIYHELLEAEEHLDYLKSYVKVKDTDENIKKELLLKDEIVNDVRRVGSSEEIEKYELLLSDLKLLHKKLEDLASTDAGAYSMISGVEGDIGNFRSCVSDISISTYIS